MKHSFVSMSVKQNLSVLVFVHKCLMALNDVEYTTYKMFVTQKMSNMRSHIVSKKLEQMACLLSWMKLYFPKEIDGEKLLLRIAQVTHS